MTQVTPSPKTSIGDEKDVKFAGAEAGAVTDVTTGTVEEEVEAFDGDDALKLVGTHAHQFDEKYYARLRRKIVSHLGLTDQARHRNSLSLSRTFTSCLCLSSSISPSS